MKILYSLGCTCDPHLTCQQHFRQHTAPSLFAGCIQLQAEYDKFIPLSLFNGDYLKYAFCKDNWTKVIRYSGTLFFDTASEEYFEYYNNLQTRKILGKHCQFKKEYEKIVFLNKQLGILNVHPFDKTPGVNPLEVEYQLKKYEFFISHMNELKFLVYLHKSTTANQLEEFEKYLIAHNISLDNFMIFSRKQNFQLKIKTVMLANADDLQANAWYSLQQATMKNEIAQLLRFP